MTRNLIPTSGVSLVCMILREILSNCGNLHNSALPNGSFRVDNPSRIAALGKPSGRL